MKILLSIIIPVYNVEKYISRCLDSIFNQGVDESLLEVIVVNDGTPDRSVSIIESYISAHKNCTLLNQQNKGLSAARNLGFEVAKGDYLWFVDSDDWLRDNSLAEVIEYIINLKFDVLSSALMYCYDDQQKNHLEKIIKKDCFVSSYIYKFNYSVGASQRYIIKRDFLKQHNLKFYPGIYHEDGEFGPRLIYFAKKVLVISKCLYNYYQRGENSIMSVWTVKNTNDAIFVYQRDKKFAISISENREKDACNYEAFRTLISAFPLSMKKDREISLMYVQYRKQIKKDGLILLFSSIPFRKKILVLLYVLCPRLFQKFVKFVRQ